MFTSAKGKQQMQVRQLQCQEQCIDYIPLPFGIVTCTFFPTFLEKAVYEQQRAPDWNRSFTNIKHRQFFKQGPAYKKRTGS